jgi:thiol-disulfide isomerase/thioredoxin
MVATVVDFLGSSNSEKLAVGLLEETIAHFQTSSTAEIQEALISLQGTQRRMNLPGNSIELSGQLLDGSELDWSSYRGKVVLVDYWATWCGPCREEIPNVLEAYRGYHDKGFEVLGISLDESPEQAKAYIETSNLPWATLFSKKKSARGWQHPMVVHYGISGIPQAILVDQEGKVVNLSARGPVLMRELQRLLGDPIAQVEAGGDSK